MFNDFGRFACEMLCRFSMMSIHVRKKFELFVPHCTPPENFQGKHKEIIENPQIFLRIFMEIIEHLYRISQGNLRKSLNFVRVSLRNILRNSLENFRKSLNITRMPWENVRKSLTIFRDSNRKI